MLRNVGFVGCVWALTIVVGCEELDPNKKARPVVNPPGIAPIGMDPSDAGRAAPANPAPQAAPAAAEAPAANPPADDGKGIIGKTDARVVDVKQAMAENPNLKVVENKTGGDDPISFAASAYVSVRSKASLLPFQAWLKQHKIVEERNPTYAEFMEQMRTHGVEFTALYPWQMYGYDSQAGAIVILEDGVMKAERYKAAGIAP